MNNLINRIRNLIGKDNQNGNRYQEIQNRHSRNNLFCGLGNRLQPPESDCCYENRDNTTYYVWAHTESNIGNIDNGVYLSKSTNTKVSNQYAEYSEQCAKRLPLVTETILDVIHRTAGNISLIIHFTILNRQYAFCILGSHTEESSNPHPEQSARATRLDCRSYADNVTGADGSGQCGTESLEAVNIAFSIISGCKNKFKSPCQLRHLQQMEAEGKQNTSSHQKHQKRRSPYKAVNTV